MEVGASEVIDWPNPARKTYMTAAPENDKAPLEEDLKAQMKSQISAAR